METMPWFSGRDAFGAWAGLRLPESAGTDWPPPLAYPAEVAATRDFGPLRRAEWLAGRLALRRALAGLGVVFDGPLAIGPRGAPVVPRGTAGSVSHKRHAGEVWAVAVAGFAADGWLGIDVEVDDAPDRVAFSLAEASAKALDPHLGRLPDPADLLVHARDDGTARVAWRDDGAAPLPDLRLRFERRDGFVLSLARVLPPGGSPRGD